jgi:hypothetical protein
MKKGPLIFNVISALCAAFIAIYICNVVNTKLL